MEKLKGQIQKMIELISKRERKSNYQIEQIIFKIERLVLWITETNKAETKAKNINESRTNGK